MSTEETTNALDFAGIITPPVTCFASNSNSNVANVNANNAISGGSSITISAGSTTSGSSTSIYVNVCSLCGQYPCTCNNTTNVPYIINPIYPVTPNVYPNTWSGTTYSWPMEEYAVRLFEMLLQGKDLITHKDKYLELIGKLSWVNGDNLQTVAVYERLRRMAKLLGIVPIKKEKKNEQENV